MLGETSRVNHVQVIKFNYVKARERFFLNEAIYTTWVLFAVEEGAFTYEIGGSAGIAVMGDLILCPTQVLFRREVISSLSFHYFEFEVSSSYGEELLNSLNARTVKITIRDLDRLRTTFQFLKMLEQDVTPLADYYRGALLTDMLQQHQMESIIPEFKRSKYEDTVISNVVEMIHSKPEAAIKFQHIAKNLQMSQSMLTARFQKVVGVSPVQYLTSVRLNKARSLLLETEMTIDEISIICGYQNGFYLSRIFTKTMGITPSRYRSTNRV
jgi:AraC family transcriptional regulator